MHLSLEPWLTAILFVLTYLGLVLGEVPKLRMDRAGIAFAGAALMLCTGALTFAQAVGPGSIDYQTLGLLFGMMIVVGFLRLSGCLARLTHWSLDRIHTPHALLALVILLAGVLSAFLVNDIVCLALTPLVLHLSKRLRFDPVPHLIGLATGANIGSVGTITGNPQNMIIGVQSRISYVIFAAHLMPVALGGLAIDFLVISLVCRPALTVERSVEIAAAGPASAQFTAGALRGRLLGRLQGKSALVAVVTVALFFAGLPMPVVAIGAAAFLLLGRLRPERIYREVDWSLLLMFTGLFVVVYAFQVHVVSRWNLAGWNVLLNHPVGLLSLASAGLSNLVSNVPAVLLLRPVMHAVPAAARQPAWLALAMSSTLAGNLTIPGSVANLIVIEKARREGTIISFWEYCKVGVPVTVLTLGLGIGWLLFVRF
ncbi:MAG TPA: anion transporter [Terriglobia bacterium]|nr:anion transporter [Terriglobia bacterium]